MERQRGVKQPQLSFTAPIENYTDSLCTWQQQCGGGFSLRKRLRAHSQARCRVDGPAALTSAADDDSMMPPPPTQGHTSGARHGWPETGNINRGATSSTTRTRPSKAGRGSTSILEDVVHTRACLQTNFTLRVVTVLEGNVSRSPQNRSYLHHRPAEKSRGSDDYRNEDDE